MNEFTTKLDEQGNTVSFYRLDTRALKYSISTHPGKVFNKDEAWIIWDNISDHTLRLAAERSAAKKLAKKRRLLNGSRN